MNRTSMAILVGLLAGIGGGLATHFVVGQDKGAVETTLPGGSADLSGVIARLDRIESAMGRTQLKVDPELRGSGHIAAAANATDAQLDALASRLEERLMPAVQESVKTSVEKALSRESDGVSMVMGDLGSAKKKRVTLAEAAAELELSSDEEESVRRIAKETTNKFFDVLANEDETGDDVRREFEEAKNDEKKRDTVRAKYLGRIVPKIGELMTLGMTHDSKMKKAVGAEKAKKLDDGYQLTDLDPYGLETMFEFD